MISKTDQWNVCIEREKSAIAAMQRKSYDFYDDIIIC